MNKPLLVELKSILSYAINSENPAFRRKAFEFAMELLSEMSMDFTMAEKAVKLEIEGKQNEANKWVERILNSVDEEEISE